MAKVTGIGGIFFKSNDPTALKDWYRTRLGFDIKSWGGAQFLFNRRDRPGVGYSVWSAFDAKTKYFAPSEKPYMVNLRVDNLDELLAQLREAGAEVLDRGEDSANGKFGYVVDPEGTLLELWEQKDDDPDVPTS